MATRSCIVTLFLLFALTFAQFGIDTSEEARDLASQDYGNMFYYEAIGVVSPENVDELVEVVKFANRAGIAIAPVGSAHSVKGQAQAENGIVVNMTNFNSIEINANDKVAWVGAGVKWRQLMHAALVYNLSAPVFTDYIDLSIAGTLSVGGIGSSTYKYGLQVDNVLELEVVTGDGKVRTCSPTKKSKLFHAVVAGYGQFGIITKAKVTLIDAKPNTRFVRTLYSELDLFLDDLFVLINEERYDGVQGFVVPNHPLYVSIYSGGSFPDLQVPVGNSEWLYMIEGSAYFADGQEPDVQYLTGGLNHLPENATNVQDISYVDYISRLDAVEAAGRQFGSWYLPHPKIDLYIGRSEAYSFIQSELDMIDYSDVNGIILVYPGFRDAVNTLNYPLPDDDEFLLFAMLKTCQPAQIDEFLAANDEMYFRCLEAGGTGYAIDSLPLTPENWEVHFGDRWEDLVKAKGKYDPNHILTPEQNMFASIDDCNFVSVTSTVTTTTTTTTAIHPLQYHPIDDDE